MIYLTSLCYFSLSGRLEKASFAVHVVFFLPEPIHFWYRIFQTGRRRLRLPFACSCAQDCFAHLIDLALIGDKKLLFASKKRRLFRAAACSFGRNSNIEGLFVPFRLILSKISSKSGPFRYFVPIGKLDIEWTHKSGRRRRRRRIRRSISHRAALGQKPTELFSRSEKDRIVQIGKAEKENKQRAGGKTTWRDFPRRCRPTDRPWLNSNWPASLLSLSLSLRFFSLRRKKRSFGIKEKRWPERRTKWGTKIRDPFEFGNRSE